MVGEEEFAGLKKVEQEGDSEGMKAWKRGEEGKEREERKEGWLCAQSRGVLAG